jgi:SAM-dependent methyltransferase
MIKDQMEKIYRTLPLDCIPWHREDVPDILASVVESGEIVPPCRVIELGCGAGNYVIYLAAKGFDAVGVDISDYAIDIARRSAAEKGVTCPFFTADVLGDMPEVEGTFGFAYDWQLLHHIFPPDREKYLQNVHRLLEPGGRYLSVCFSEESQQFGGTGKYRRTPLDTVLYFSSEEEILSFLEPLFHVEELKTVDIQGKFAVLRAVYASAKRK